MQTRDQNFMAYQRTHYASGGGLQTPISYFGSEYDESGQFDQTGQQAAILNPEHAHVSRGAKKTPLEVQLGLTLLPVRYLPRAFFKSGADSAVPGWLRKLTLIDVAREHLYFPRYEREVNAKLKAFEPHLKQMFGGHVVDTRNMPGKEIYELINTHEAGKTFYSDIQKLLTSWDARDQSFNTIEHSIRKYATEGGLRLTPESRRRLAGKMSDMLFETFFDTAIGGGSWLYTNRVQRGVHNDIMSIYSEAVAYENGKRPDAQHDDDIAASSNEIVQSTVRNYRTMRALRYTLSSLPFFKHIPKFRAIQWGEATVAGWGILWARDIMGREPTMMENFRSFVNDKLNPLYGIGDQIKSSEIIDLYQQYAYRFHPEIAFRSISVNDEGANRMWAQSEKLFGRIADLMNDSYNFKHTSEIDPNTNVPTVKADFTLPKFIYLLGHGLINARKPEWSMAFIELANKSKDMSEVKEAALAMRKNVNLSEIVEKYQLDLNPNGHVNGVLGHVINRKAATQQEAPAPTAANENETDASAETNAQETAKHTENKAEHKDASPAPQPKASEKTQKPEPSEKPEKTAASEKPSSKIDSSQLVAANSNRLEAASDKAIA